MDKKEVSYGNGSICSYGHCSMKGYRPTMEDRHSTIVDAVFNNNNKGSFFGVYDGHGGDQVADFVSKTLPQELMGSQTNIYKDEEIINTFVKIDNLITENDTGSTCVVSSIVKSQDSEDFVIICANSGDSRCIYYEKLKSESEGKITQLSFDQKPTQDEEKKRILESGNIVLIGRVNGSLAVSRAFGDQRYKKSKDKNEQLFPPDKQAVTVCPVVTRTKIESSDKRELAFLVLACDGIWDVWKNEYLCQQIKDEIEKLGKTDQVLAQIAENCVTKAIKEYGSSDNCTLIIVLLH